ncbi:MAG: DNA polymerase III subunit beta [Thiotrichaceae bacterium]|nr:DNA polymerase III subunit beta [Thiotrichaceae bacterium]
MKLTISRKSFLPILEKCCSPVEYKSTKPILTNIYFSASVEGLLIAGTNLNIEIIGTLGNTGIEKYGSTTVNAKKILDITKAMDQDSLLLIELKGNELHIKSQSSLFRLSVIPSQEYPLLGDLSFDQALTVTESSFKKGLDKTSYAMAQNDVRFYLNGIYFKIDENTIDIVATDGHRLATSQLPLLESTTVIQSSIIIPRQAINEIGRLINNDSQVSMSLLINKTHLRINKDNLQFTTKLLEGNYPNYQSALPKHCKHTITFDYTQLKNCLTRVGILTADKFKAVSLTLENNKLLVQSTNPERESAFDTLAINYNDDKFEVGFNVTYLLDAINHIDSETITFCLNDEHSSSSLTSLDEPNSLNIVMPIKL